MPEGQMPWADKVIQNIWYKQYQTFKAIEDIENLFGDQLKDLDLSDANNYWPVLRGILREVSVLWNRHQEHVRRLDNTTYTYLEMFFTVPDEDNQSIDGWLQPLLDRVCPHPMD